MRKPPASSGDPLDQRLVRVAGQVEGIRRMAREGRDCVEILTQIASIRAALDQVGIELLTHHMRDRAAGEGCKADAGIEAAERTEELRTALNRLLT